MDRKEDREFDLERKANLWNLKLDVHTHTIASGHAYATVTEMVKAASERGLELIGITEHAKGIPGTCDSMYFHNMKIIPRKMYGVEVMMGAEINILDYDGTLEPG